MANPRVLGTAFLLGICATLGIYNFDIWVDGELDSPYWDLFKFPPR